ncbi:12085_t:CDS:2, partial [Racocetra fulgida]
ADRGQDRYKEVIPEAVPFRQENIIPLPARLREIVESRFIDNAHYVLVIATDKAIYVFGFSSNPDGIIFHDMSSDRYRTDYSKKEIGSIIGTDDGRIFLIDAGELCELVYEAYYIQKDAALKLIGTYSINDDKSMMLKETPAMLKTKEPNGLYILEVHDPPPQNQQPIPQQTRLEYQKFRYFHGIFFAQRREGGIEMLSTTCPNYGLMFSRFIQ